MGLPTDVEVVKFSVRRRSSRSSRVQREQAADVDAFRSECLLHGGVHRAEPGAVRPQKRVTLRLLVEVDPRRRAARSRMQQHLGGENTCVSPYSQPKPAAYSTGLVRGQPHLRDSIGDVNR